MSKKKKRIFQPINEVEIIDRRTKKTRKINLQDKEIIIYNEDLNKFQLIEMSGSNYDEDKEPKNE
jgi:hypothetical protein